MCGRYTQASSYTKISQVFGVDASGREDHPRYNVAPGQYIDAVLIDQDDRRILTNLKWGLIPAWSKDASFAAKTINARAESIDEKPTFRDAFKKRSCIIPANGFYEWQKTASGKQPYYFYMKDREPFGFAGLWESWTDKSTGEAIETATIITTEANEILGKVHHRMPVIVAPEDYALWLEPRLKPEDRKGFLIPYPSDLMAMHPVSRAVNNAASNDASLIEPLNSL